MPYVVVKINNNAKLKFFPFSFLFYKNNHIVQAFQRSARRHPLGEAAVSRVCREGRKRGLGADPEHGQPGLRAHPELHTYRDGYRKFYNTVIGQCAYLVMRRFFSQDMISLASSERRFHIIVRDRNDEVPRFTVDQFVGTVDEELTPADYMEKQVSCVSEFQDLYLYYNILSCLLTVVKQADAYARLSEEDVGSSPSSLPLLSVCMMIFLFFSPSLRYTSNRSHI